ncbi:MAG: 30S ribosomal protein S13 [Candidatus Eisenbacteria bacterium]|uniref:Small ribosomal subunit protein uS13 n=1 Tax=Eiseniibacteriota bacterium TaxID=2212470 RepID=A0A956LZA3_UNCEI|nr:30S ribosomal protein S13 [Candidatus Eisenbacteria bacterium]
MARIAGVDLPNEKRLDIALTYIFGIGRATAHKILTTTKLDPSKRVSALSEEESAVLRAEIENNYRVEGTLHTEVGMSIKRLMDIGSYRGLRHRRGLPARGQRTKTNARTRKGPKKSPGSLKKK